MSFDDFCRNLRGTSGANELSADLLLFLYNSVKKTPIEWKSNKVDLSLKNMSPDERARICDLEFVQECDMYLSQAFGHIRDESVYRKSYLNSNSANIASCIFDLFWPQALSAFSVASQSKSSKILSYCLDGLKYVLSSAVLLCRPNEIDSFLPILAKISFSYGYTGTNEDLQRSLIKGAHLEQEWLSVRNFS
jgi:Sec7-like guanine-nucleotide exchange factor